MAIESANYLGDLVQTYPAETESMAEGDDHLRTIKKTLKQTFPGRTKPEDAYTELVGANVTFTTSQIGQLLVPLSATTIALPKLGADYAGYVFKFIPGVNGTLAGVGGDTVNGAATLPYEAGGVYVVSGASGVAWKVYRAGGGASSFPSGTRMAFAQAAAPVGWTQDTTEAADNRMLRVVKTAGGSSGGSHSPILNNVVPAHIHNITTGIESEAHSHTVNDPTHTHQVFVNSYANVSYGGAFAAAIYSAGYVAPAYTGISLGDQSSSHTHSGTTDNGSSQTNWTPRYIDMIIATRN